MDLDDVTAVPFLVGFFVAGSWKKRHQKRAAVTSLRPFLFRDDFSYIRDHPFKTSACLRRGGVSPCADGQKVTVHKDQKSPSKAFCWNDDGRGQKSWKFADVLNGWSLNPRTYSKYYGRLFTKLHFFLLLYPNMEVWFQNCRAKWKKQRKRSSMLHSPTSLFPSHSLSPLMPSFSTGWGSSGYTGGCLILIVFCGFWFCMNCKVWKQNSS